MLFRGSDGLEFIRFHRKYVGLLEFSEEEVLLRGEFLYIFCFGEGLLWGKYLCIFLVLEGFGCQILSEEYWVSSCLVEKFWFLGKNCVCQFQQGSFGLLGFGRVASDIIRMLFC